MPRPLIVPVTLLASALALALGCAGADGPAPTRPQEDPVKPTAPAAKPPKPASEISFRQEEPWYTADASFRATLGFAQPIKQTPVPFGYRPDAEYTGPTDWTKLVIDLSCSSHDRAPDAPAPEGDGPLASLDAVQIFGEDRSKPLAVFSRAELVLERGNANSFEHDGRGPIVVSVERVRIPFAKQATLVRDAHPYRLTVVALDAQGRTMACDDIDGDEASEPLTAQPDPESGWVRAPKVPPPAPRGK